MNIYFLRHCETDYTRENQGHTLDTPLTSNGKSHADSISKSLEQLFFDKIFCSDSLHSRQTILSYVKSKNIKVHYDSRIREIEDIVNGYGHEHVWLESIESQKSRLESVYYDITKMNHKSILLVTHYGVIEYLSKKFNQYIENPSCGSLNMISIVKQSNI